MLIRRRKDKVNWKKLYSEGDAHWADDMQSSQFAQEFAQEVLARGEKTILEIGCGCGRDAILFAQAGLEVSAIDIVPEAIKIAEDNAKKAGVKIHFEVGSSEKLPFSIVSFDAIFTLSVLHSANIDKSILEMRKVLKYRKVAFIHIYSDVEKIDGTKIVFVSLDEYVNLIRKHEFKLLDLYTHSEANFDEAGERHKIIVSRVQK